jgi:LPXTG-site transpeptidase (sortase) family protein
MSTHPIFPDNPLRPEPADNAAVELVRAKVARAYGEEPAVTEELEQAKHEKTPSKHQLFLREISQGDKSLAEIQTEWHRYYTQLSDDDKREVWAEFYAANQHTPYQKLFQKQVPVASRQRLAAQPAQTLTTPGSAEPDTAKTSQVVQTASGVTVGGGVAAAHRKLPRGHAKRKKALSTKAARAVRKTKVGRDLLDSEAAAATLRLKRTVVDKVNARGQLQAKHHVQSLLFGLGLGTVMLLVLLFGFFNEYIIAPFIQPSSKVSSMPIIVNNLSAEQLAAPTIVVNKINIQIPVDFGLPSNEEATIQNSLENGVVHYPSTALPGQNGNGAYFGHSSSNIFNNGKYKFAFVRLREMVTGDVFSVIYQGKIYYYQVFAKEIVPPTQVSVLTDTKGEQATATLITCDPPGLSTNRLVVWGKQISPNPSFNAAPAPAVTAHPEKISSNGPTLWTRMWRAIAFW